MFKYGLQIHQYLLIHNKGLENYPPVVDWDAPFKKGVRTKDGIGVVVKVHGDTIAIQDTPRKEYIVPKDTVEGFDGNEVYLRLTKKQLEKYETKI